MTTDKKTACLEDLRMMSHPDPTGMRPHFASIMAFRARLFVRYFNVLAGRGI